MTPERPANLTLEAILGEHLALYPTADGILAAACPFCQPIGLSLEIDQATELWCCAVCGQGGDMLSFLMRYHAVPFPIAVCMLVDRVADADRE